MELSAFINKLSNCIEKAYLDTTWVVSTDEDEICDIFIHRSGRIEIGGCRMVYYANEVERVKYCVNDVENHLYVVIVFNDGSSLEFGNRDEKKYFNTASPDVGASTITSNMT